MRRPPSRTAAVPVLLAALAIAAALAPAGARGDLGADAVIAPPADSARWPAFREELARWRTEERRRMGYDDSLYRRPDLAWTSSSFCQALLNVWDLAVYDPQSGKFQVEGLIERGTRQFGGYDSVILWHAYPRIGFDDRNQFDFYRDLPGGLAGVRDLSRALKAKGVRLFIDYNPWDVGTRREGRPDAQVLAELVKEVEADGVFLDTWGKAPGDLRRALDAARPGVALEPELDLPRDGLAGHVFSWAQELKLLPIPGILREKWLERRHLQHQTRRWATDHIDELHAAWMNGSGFEVWEMVFGSWVGTAARDRSVLRAMLPVQRRWADLFCGEGWTPLVPTLKPSVYAGLWEGRGIRIWTLANRCSSDVCGKFLEVPHVEGVRYFDVIAGREAEAAVANGATTISGRLRARGIGGFVAGKEADLGADFAGFLARQAAIEGRSDFTGRVPQQTVALKPPPRAAHRQVPPGMAEVPATTFEMKVEFRYEGRELGSYLPFQKIDRSGPWGEKGPITASTVKVKRFAIDLTPVTNAAFKRFLDESGWKPRHAENFLKHWVNGAPPPGKEEHPVVHVDLDDARAYAAWAGKRLPTEPEWQLAAGGPAGLRWPWGNEWKEGASNGKGGATTPVKAFPDGRSPFGCYDMCGNVWQWTESEHADRRIRFAIVRGGSCYKAEGSGWYADGGPQPTGFAAKFLLLWPGTDRCGTIGFRCAVDLEG